MSIFAKLFGRKLPEKNPNELKPEEWEIVEVDTEGGTGNPPAEVVGREGLAAKVSETFSNISELLKTINGELVAQRESASTFQDTARAQMELMTTLGGKVEKQNEAHAALVQALIDLPENLKKIPENAEHQTQLLREMNESIRTRGMEVNASFDRINLMLDEVPRNAERHLESLDRINERFEIVTGFNEMLSKICDATESQARSIAVMEENTGRSLEYVSEMKKAAVRQGRQSALLLSAILFLVLVFGSIGVWQICVR